MSDSPARSVTGRIWPGKRGAKATWPGASAEYSVTNRLPPVAARLRPAQKPPSVCVFIAMPSDIHAIWWVWLTIVSPRSRSIETVCITVPEIS